MLSTLYWLCVYCHRTISVRQATLCRRRRPRLFWRLQGPGVRRLACAAKMVDRIRCREFSYSLMVTELQNRAASSGPSVWDGAIEHGRVQQT